jgi:hypothetical protein
VLLRFRWTCRVEVWGGGESIAGSAAAQEMVGLHDESDVIAEGASWSRGSDDPIRSGTCAMRSRERLVVFTGRGWAANAELYCAVNVRLLAPIEVCNAVKFGDRVSFANAIFCYN